MSEIVPHNENICILWTVILGLTLTICRGYEEATAGPFRIGILSSVSIHSPVIEGFKKGMAESGYVEGRDVEYIYNGVIENDNIMRTTC